MVTLSAAWLAALRTCRTNLAGLPTWISPGANFCITSVGCCGPSRAFSPGLPLPGPFAVPIGSVDTGDIEPGAGGSAPMSFLDGPPYGAACELRYLLASRLA